MKKNYRLVIISISVALCVVLDYIKTFLPFLNMPFGGSINIALIPIVIVSYIYSYKEGCTVGILWWLISTLLGLNNWFISIGQYLFDYIIPSVIPGFASLLCIKNKNKNIEMCSGIIAVMVVRTVCLIISGAYYWPSGNASGSFMAWISSVTYNVPYNLLTCILLCVVCTMSVKRISNIVLR